MYIYVTIFSLQFFQIVLKLNCLKYFPHQHDKLVTLEFYFLLFSDSAQSMRFGLDLCAEETVYLQQRKPKVLAGLSAFLGNKDDNPQSVSEVHKYIL